MYEPLLAAASGTVSPAALRSDRSTVSSTASAAPLIVMTPDTIVSRTSTSSVVVSLAVMTMPLCRRANRLAGAIAVGPVAEKKTS